MALLFICGYILSDLLVKVAELYKDMATEMLNLAMKLDKSDAASRCRVRDQKTIVHRGVSDSHSS